MLKYSWFRASCRKSSSRITPARASESAPTGISNARVGTLSLAFAGSAGDIYGRYLGYYFLNILAWLAAIAAAVDEAGGHAVAGNLSFELVAPGDQLGEFGSLYHAATCRRTYAIFLCSAY